MNFLGRGESPESYWQWAAEYLMGLSGHPPTTTTTHFVLLIFHRPQKLQEAIKMQLVCDMQAPRRTEQEPCWGSSQCLARQAQCFKEITAGGQASLRSLDGVVAQ